MAPVTAFLIPDTCGPEWKFSCLYSVKRLIHSHALRRSDLGVCSLVICDTADTNIRVTLLDRPNQNANTLNTSSSCRRATGVTQLLHLCRRMSWEELPGSPWPLNYKKQKHEISHNRRGHNTMSFTFYPTLSGCDIIVFIYENYLV
jgi:hypothetical protein